MTITDEKVLNLFRGHGRCSWCKKHVRRLEPHHYWFKRGIGGGSRLDVPENIIALCATFTGGDNCHDEAEAYRITKYDLLAIVAARENCQQQDIIDYLNLLRRLPKHAPTPTGPGKRKAHADHQRRNGQGCRDDGLRGNLPVSDFRDGSSVASAESEEWFSL